MTYIPPVLALLAFFAARAQAGAPLFFSEGKVHVQAHRGASAEFEENTLPAFLRAIELGADSLELDLHVTRDGEVIIFHDFSLDRHSTEGSDPGGDIRKLTLTEVKALRLRKTSRMRSARTLTAGERTAPTLDELFELVRSSTSPNSRKIAIDLEIKSDPLRPDLSPAPEEFARIVLAKVGSSGLKGQIVIRSFDHRVLEAVRRLDASLPLIALTEGPFDYIKLARTLRPLAIAPEFQHVTREDVEALHRLKVGVIPWTVNGDAMYEEALGKGVDGITTDHPRELMKFLRRRSNPAGRASRPRPPFLSPVKSRH